MHIDQFRKYLGSKSKVSKIAQIFGRYFFLLNLKGRPSKNCTHIIIPASRHIVRRLEKFLEDTPTSPEVIGGAYAEF